MASDDLGRNLRLLCSYGRSISAVCRQARVNRHQLQRYLNGSAFPSLHTLRRLCDFFGVEEHEILLPHREFAALVQVRPPRFHQVRDRIADYMSGFNEAQDLGAAARYEGYYHIYFQPNRTVPEIHRALTRLSLEDRCLVTKTMERYPAGSAGLSRMVKYSGIAFAGPAALTVIERRPSARASTFVTMLYPADPGDSSPPTVISGLVLGVAPDASRTIYALRTCWRFLGRDIDLRKALRQCGQFPRDSRQIDRYIRYCTRNDLAPGDEAFEPHV